MTSGDATASEEVPPPRRELLLVLLLALVALGTRLACVAWIGPVEPQGDQRSYVHGAESLLAGETYAERRAPGYSAFLACAQALLGRGPQSGRHANAWLGALFVVLVWRFAREHLRPRSALVAAALVALHPRFVTLPAYLLSENLYLVLVAGACLALGAARRAAPSRGALAARTLAAGALLGLAALTRSQMLYFVPLAAAVSAWPLSGPGRREALLRALQVVLGAVAVVAPWTVRNAFVHHAFVPIGFADGIPLFEGNYVERNPGDMKARRQELNLLFYREGGDSELEANRQMRDVALGLIAERQPAWFFEKLAENGPRLYTPVLVTPYPWELRGDPPGAWPERALVAWHLPLHLFCLLLFPLGLAAVHRRPGLDVALAYVAYSALVHVVANAGFARFQMPYEWILIVLACSVLDGARPCGRRRVAVAVVLAALLLAAQLPLLGWWRRLLRTVFLGDS